MNPTGGGWVIAVTLLVAMFLSVFHLPQEWPNWLGWLRPNWMVLVLFFWTVEVPHRVSLLAVWLLGFFVDALLAEPLGLNGIILAGVTYFTWGFYERLRMYSALQQGAVVFVLVVAAELLRYLVLSILGSRPWSWGVLSVPLVSMLLWPFVYILLIRLRTGMRIE